MKVYWYGYKMGFHNSSKLVKSAIIQNQKPSIVLKQFLYKKHFFDTWFQEEMSISISYLYKNSLNTIDGFWFWLNADFTNLVESWKPTWWPNLYIFKIPSLLDLEALFQMNQSEFWYKLHFFRNHAWKFRNFQLKISKIF